MCQSLSYAEFRWVDNIADFDVNTTIPDHTHELHSRGRFRKVYSQNIYNKHIDLSFCPTRDFAVRQTVK